ncbi:MAG: hypothetical protein LBD68_10125 [Zoogloeaceae bacterium]|jgi:hypothetical protein|nr:hypothetical protein [Zoogloeaceae bacterium]
MTNRVFEWTAPTLLAVPPKKIILTAALTALALAALAFSNAFAQTQSSEVASLEQKLLGSHLFSLQWVSWKKFGTAEITRKEDGQLYIDASQSLDGNYVTLQGVLTPINAAEFTVEGELITRTSDINNSEPCARSGTFNFKATGTRKYWRLQQMNNPCDGIYAEYVDVFFK